MGSWVFVVSEKLDNAEGPQAGCQKRKDWGNGIGINTCRVFTFLLQFDGIYLKKKYNRRIPLTGSGSSHG